jgi:hypothetical protein
MDWKQLLAYITGSVAEELLVRNEYLAAENRILRNQITGRLRLSDGERKTLAEIGIKLGKQALEDKARQNYLYSSAELSRPGERLPSDSYRIADLHT